MPIAVHVIGAKGKVGSRVAALAQSKPDFALAQSWSGAEVGIDFTTPDATKKILSEAVFHSTPLVIGTTGHSSENIDAMEAAARTIPVLYSPNFSLGIAACLEAAISLTRTLGEEASIEIIEAHHAHKKDSPSGTALAFAEAISKQVPIHSIRAGDIAGDHTIIFALNGERIELKHQAHSREAYAAGALKAAAFLAGKPAGLYTMKDLCTTSK